MKNIFLFLIISMMILSSNAYAQNICGTPIGTNDYIQNLSNGDYAVVVTNANGCTAIASTTISNTNNLSLTLYPGQNHCNMTNGGYINASANGGSPYTYLWSNGGTNDYIQNLVNGTYTVTVTNATGCTTTASTTISNTNNLSLTLYPGQNHCNMTNVGYINASANGGSPYTYQWSNGGTNDYIQNLVNGTYTVTVTNVTGCTATASTTIINTNNLSMNLYSIQNHCNLTNGGYIDVSPNGGSPYTYQWSNGGTNKYVQNLVNGTYIVTVTNATGCTATASNTISNTNNLSMNLYSIQNHCNLINGGYINTSPNGGSPYTYQWSNGGTNDYIQNLINGIYTVTVTNATGCTATASTTISNTNNLSLTLYYGQNHCNMTNGGYINASPNGGSPYTYQWSNGVTNNYLQNLVNGTYTVIVTNSTGCTATASNIISNTNNLSLTLYAGQNHCNMTNGGYINASANGGSPFTYQWYLLTPGSLPVISQNGQLLTATAAATYQWMLNGTDINGANSQTYFATVSGTYTLHVTYASGCISISAPVQVNIVSGIDPVNEVSQLVVYPNPAQNNLTIRIDKPTVLVISNLLGKTILQTKLEFSGSIDISALSPGIYFIYNIQRTAMAKFVKE